MIPALPPLSGRRAARGRPPATGARRSGSIASFQIIPAKACRCTALASGSKMFALQVAVKLVGLLCLLSTIWSKSSNGRSKF